ncbi:MAG: GWxTD domain-containing protein [candidate division Zixibacteria bacterium]|nr:GWxTD domain-containing protein [candidate division Zixibacteria bacterium]
MGAHGRRAVWCPAPVARMLLFAVVALLLGTPGAQAVEGTGPLRFRADYAAYRKAVNSSDSYVEFYFELKRVDFRFHPFDSLYQAEVHAWVHVSDTSGAPVDSVGGAFRSVASDSSALSDSNFIVFFARALILPPGSYNARLVVTDMVSKASSEALLPLSIQDFSRPALHMSDIEFGYDIISQPPDTGATLGDVLVKNRYKVYPDCRGVLGGDRPRLFFYTEVYNLAFDPSRDNSYDIAVSVAPPDSVAGKVLKVQKLTKAGTSAVLASGVDVRELPAGPYSLRIDVTDPATGQTARAKKGFHVVTQGMGDSLSASDVQRMRDIFAYIITPEQSQTFERLNNTGRKAFWVQFWKDRDPSTGTTENEFKDEHMRRMNYANERFSIGYQNRTDGWRTDMGRVYIVYGPPNTIERYPFTPEGSPAEMWFYDNLTGQGQVYFLFIDESGYGEYNMVHSTARGERRDPKWEAQVNQGTFDRNK